MEQLLRIAVDTGGTFTDCVYWSRGELQILKVPSSPEDPAKAVLDAVAQIAYGAPVEVRHGTTVGTNALLERKGARVVFVTTAGFEDTIEIGRQARPKLYDLFWTKDPPLAPAQMRFGVNERVASDGQILRALDASELTGLREAIRAKQPEAIAISLLFSFANPKHEQAAARALSEIGVPISVSHEILPEFREYERGSTVLINAYLAPKVQRYIERLRDGLGAPGSQLHVMQSSGGIVPAQFAEREPVRTILSGPAGGVIGALRVARTAGFTRILTFDMGGTSTDVALVDAEGGLKTTTESEILGMPVAVPMLQIHTVGAGGGSLASFDRGGALKVGPESAGANPGPICYGKGELPTVSDANLILGRIHPDHFLGGNMPLDVARARAAFEDQKGTVPSPEAFAEGVICVVDAHMERALRRISIEQGHDARDFVLVSFGGAGPLHACALARALQISKVVVPVNPGALSAYGIFVSDIVRDYSRTVMLPPGDPALEGHFCELEKPGEGLVVRTLDMRYAGQGYELSVEWSGDYVSSFHRLHAQRYGYSDPKRPVEVVNVRVRMISETHELAPKRYDLRDGDGKQAFTGKYAGNTLFDRMLLRSGDRFDGPAVIVEYSATTFVPAGCGVFVDEYANLILEIGA